MLTVFLTPEEEAKLVAQAQARGVSPDVLARDALKQLIAGASGSESVKQPMRSLYGFLAKYSPAPSEEEIDENRREMFANFGRDDIA